MVGHPPFRPGGVGKASLLPNKFIPPGVAKATSSSSANNSNPVGDSTSNLPASPVSDEQRLNLAYSHYLYNQTALLLGQRIEENRLLAKEEDCVAAALKSDYAKGFVQMNTELCLQFNRILILKRLLSTDEFLKMYTSLEKKFQEQACTMGELQKALGSKFEYLEMQNLEGCGDLEDTEMDVDELINQVKKHLSTPHSPTKDGKSFLLMFTDALRGAISNAAAVEKEKVDGAAVDSDLLKLNSLKISDKMASRAMDGQDY